MLEFFILFLILYIYIKNKIVGLFIVFYKLYVWVFEYMDL